MTSTRLDEHHDHHHEDDPVRLDRYKDDPKVPATLAGYVAMHRPRMDRFGCTPTAGYCAQVAGFYNTTALVVRAAFARRAAPASPPASDRPARASLPAVARPPEPLAPRSVGVERAASTSEHPFDRVVSILRDGGAKIIRKRDAHGREAVRATCPAHHDPRPSLAVTADGPNALLHCFAGCKTASVVAALGLKMADLFSGPPTGTPRRRVPIVKPAPPPPLSREERLARQRQKGAARIARWRARRCEERRGHSGGGK